MCLTALKRFSLVVIVSDTLLFKTINFIYFRFFLMLLFLIFLTLQCSRLLLYLSFDSKCSLAPRLL